MAAAIAAVLGSVGGLIFYGRFWVQWIASERKKQSVIPVAFWYMSSIGALMLFTYDVLIVSPGAAFGVCFNILVYSRNLAHIWREQGALTKKLNVAVHAVAAVIAAVAVVFTVVVWVWEIQENRMLDPAKAAQNWFWLKVWGVGQVMFFLRFFIQWLVTEIKGKSVVPAAFWYLSLGAALCQAPSFVQQRDWVNSIGMTASIFIYARNLWFVYHAREGTEAPVADT
jgi:lipid-A-disaccharide synthase-like uncharacterized protein